MIIDLILDRKNGDRFNAKSFYNDIREYENIFEFEYLNISGAFEYGSNEQVQEELCKYIMQNGYNHEICEYIKSVSWIEDDKITVEYIQMLAKSFLSTADALNEKVSRYIDGSNDKDDFLAFKLVEAKDHEFTDAVNEYEGYKAYEYCFNYELAESFLAA